MSSNKRIVNSNHVFNNLRPDVIRCPATSNWKITTVVFLLTHANGSQAPLEFGTRKSDFGEVSGYWSLEYCVSVEVMMPMLAGVVPVAVVAMTALPM
ncbi:hypothetical protein RHMOL_Rhmol10G0032000 [Rhododendron molle]|uniref:Uncharacterized protein n=1 Tax=Rhododendron molle TaxID=49168 RepID=A0ACC0LYK5_RHOML|nr:hypothetical protein RHMOL_Rhmol10G0032000 [Rhododendron molle]